MSLSALATVSIVMAVYSQRTTKLLQCHSSEKSDLYKRSPVTLYLF